MNRAEKKKNKRIVRDMKESFQSFHLPVQDIKSPHADEMNVVFGSQLCNDHVCAAVIVTHGMPEGYVGMEADFHFKVPSERMAEVMRLLNLINGSSPLFGYSVCQCCNGVSMHASLVLPDGSLPQGKFKRLIHEMLEDAYLCSPLMTEVIKGGKAETVYDGFIDDHQGSMSMEGQIPQKARTQILADMESVLLGLKITIKEEERHDYGFVMDFGFSDVNFPLRMAIRSEHENKTVTLSLAPPFVVPDEKIPAMMELVNRMNKMSGPDHWYINQQTKRVVLLRGIMVDNGVLDKKEFEIAVRTLLGTGCLFFPVVNERISSNESLEVLWERLKENYQRQ